MLIRSIKLIHTYPRPRHYFAFMYPCSFDSTHITSHSGRLKLREAGERIFMFVCSLYWPFVDSYWTTCFTLLSVSANRNATQVSVCECVYVWLYRRS